MVRRSLVVAVVLLLAVLSRRRQPEPAEVRWIEPEDGVQRDERLDDLVQQLFTAYRVDYR